MKQLYLDVSQEAGSALFTQNIQGPVVLLNLLRFRKVADYSQDPELRPHQSVSGAQAFQKYLDLTTPLLEASGGSIAFLGKGGSYLIGPEDQHWDFVMLIRQKSVQDFMAFSTNTEYLAILGHRTAALKDSRLLPLIEASQVI